MKNHLKNLNAFTVSVMLFLLIVFYSVYLYYQYEQPLDARAAGDSIKVEVNLPDLEWDKYTALSKKINISSDMKVRRKMVENIEDKAFLAPYR